MQFFWCPFTGQQNRELLPRKGKIKGKIRQIKDNLPDFCD
jgi:hypothetical protein